TVFRIFKLGRSVPSNRALSIKSLVIDIAQPAKITLHSRSHNVSSWVGERASGISTHEIGVGRKAVDQRIGRVEIQVVQVILIVFMACQAVDGVFSDFLIIGKQLLCVDNRHVLVSLSKSTNTLVRAGFTVAVSGSYFREPVIRHVGSQTEIIQ